MKRGVYFFHFSLFTFHFSLFTFHFSLFTFHFSLFTFHFSLFTFHFSLAQQIINSNPAQIPNQRVKRNIAHVPQEVDLQDTH